MTATASSAAPAGLGRLPALDGLRGLAAVVVVLHHGLLLVPALAEPYRSPGAGEGLAWLMTYTPLHLVWAGTEAVLVFFVLSGYVLTRPALGRSASGWVGYYLSRLPRLYLPIWAAVGLSALLAVVVARRPVEGGSYWLNAHGDVAREDVVRSSVLLTEPSFALNSPFWSLRLEILFSVALPLYVLVAVRLRRGLALKVALLLAAVAVGVEAGSRLGTYLPVFAFGALMVVHADGLRATAERVQAARLWPVVLVVSALLLSAYWLVLGVLGEQAPRALRVGAVAAQVLGAAVLLWVFLHWRPAVRLGQAPVVAWLGVRSFSLYLVHEPVLVSAAFLLDGRGGPATAVLVAVPVSLLVADLFARLVERPAHTLSKALGRRAAPA